MLNNLQKSPVFTYTMNISLNDSISNHENIFDDYPRTPPTLPRVFNNISPRTHTDISYPHVSNKGANIIQVVISISSICMYEILLNIRKNTDYEYGFVQVN